MLAHETRMSRHCDSFGRVDRRDRPAVVSLHLGAHLKSRDQILKRERVRGISPEGGIGGDEDGVDVGQTTRDGLVGNILPQGLALQWFGRSRRTWRRATATLGRFRRASRLRDPTILDRLLVDTMSGSTRMSVANAYRAPAARQ